MLFEITIPDSVQIKRKVMVQDGTVKTIGSMYSFNDLVDDMFDKDPSIVERLEKNLFRAIALRQRLTGSEATPGKTVRLSAEEHEAICPTAKFPPIDVVIAYQSESLLRAIVDAKKIDEI